MCFEIKLDSVVSLYAYAMNTAKGQKSRFSIIYKLSRIDSNLNRTFSIRFGLWSGSNVGLVFFSMNIMMVDSKLWLALC